MTLGPEAAMLPAKFVWQPPHCWHMTLNQSHTATMSVNAPRAPGEPSHGSESSFSPLGCSYLTRALLQLHSRETWELRRGGCRRPPACLVCLPPPLVHLRPAAAEAAAQRRAAPSDTDRQTAELRLSPPEPLQSFDSALVQHWQRTQSHKQPAVSTNTPTAQTGRNNPLCYKNDISNIQYITTSRQIRAEKEFKKSPGSAFLETSCITTSKNPSSKNQTSSILGIWARDRTTFSGRGRDVFFPCGGKDSFSKRFFSHFLRAVVLSASKSRPEYFKECENKNYFVK